MVSSMTITSCASISFWTSGSPNLSPRPLMFQVKIRNEFNRRVSLADRRHLASGLEARCWVSCGESYLFNISFSTSDWIDLAKRSFFYLKFALIWVSDNPHIDGWVQKKDVTPLLTHWSYVFLALTHRYVWHLHTFPKGLSDIPD